MTGQPLDPDLYARLAPLFRAAQVGGCVSSVAHDVNNYLGAMLAYSELIQQGDSLNDEARRMMGNVIKSVQKCSALVSTITVVARKERPDVTLVSVPEFLDQTLDLKRHDFRSSHVGLDLNCPDQLPSLFIDRPKLMMALLYLLVNALEAVEGAAKPRTALTATATSDSVEFAIKDSGPEIPQPVRDLMFEPFYTTKPDPHFGLGLTAARGIARFHGGDLIYDAARGFVMTLPLASRLKL